MNLLQPKFIKYKKIRKGKLKKYNYKFNQLKFGDLGIKALESGYISSYQIKAINIFLKKKFKKNAKIWSFLYPNIPITYKSLGVRMGKGKGSIQYWSNRITAGKVLYEITSNLPLNFLLTILTKVQFKFSIKTKIIKIKKIIEI